MRFWPRAIGERHSAFVLPVNLGLIAAGLARSGQKQIGDGDQQIPERYCENQPRRKMRVSRRARPQAEGKKPE